MLGGLSDRVLPDVQRRTLDELTEDLDPPSATRSEAESAFWTMLVLSRNHRPLPECSPDSTATVIGAMIIAPCRRRS